MLLVYTVALLDGPKDDKDNNEIVLESEAANIPSSLNNTSLRSISAVEAFIPFLEEARSKVTNEMENMVLTGLTTLVNRALFSCQSIRTKHRLESIITCLFPPNCLQPPGSSPTRPESHIRPCSSCRGEDTKRVRYEQDF